MSNVKCQKSRHVKCPRFRKIKCQMFQWQMFQCHMLLFSIEKKSDILIFDEKFGENISVKMTFSLREAEKITKR